MADPGQPTVSLSATGDAVKRLERALRRTPDLGLTVDGVFGPQVETAVKQFQQGAGLTVDGIVGPATWAALPDGGPMPVKLGNPRPETAAFHDRAAASIAGAKSGEARAAAATTRPADPAAAR